MSDEILHVTELFSLDDIPFVEACYKLLLRREADNSGLRYYLGRLAIGYSRESIIYDLTRSKEYNNKNSLIGLEKIIKQEKMRQNWLFRIFIKNRPRRIDGTISIGSRDKSSMLSVSQIAKINEHSQSKSQDGEVLFYYDKLISLQQDPQKQSVNNNIDIKSSKKTLKIDDTIVYERPLFNKILAIKLDHRGDLILFHPALKKLRNRYPKAQIDVLVGSWNKEQLSSFGIVDNIITYDFFKPVSAHSPRLNYKDLVIAMSKTDEYDLAIDFRRDSDTRFVLQNIRAGFTIGYQSHNADIDSAMSICLDYNCLEPGVRVPENYTHMSYQMVKLVDSIPYHHTDYIDIKCGGMTDINVLKVGIFPYCGTAFRDWKRENYKEVIDILLEKHKDVIIDIYLAVEDDFFFDCYGDDPRVNVFIGLDYDELNLSLSRCRVVLSNNSYGGHLAGLLGVPSVIIFSGTELPQEWRPAYGRNIVIYHDIECSPCHSNNVLQCPYDITCMDISVSDVYEQLSSIMESKPADLLNGGEWSTFKNRLFSRLPDKSNIEIGKLREIHVAYANNHRNADFSFDIVIARLYGDNDLSAIDINKIKILYVTVKPDGNVFEALSGRHVPHANIENSVVFVVNKNAKDIIHYNKFIRVASERNCTVIVIIDDYVGEIIKTNVNILPDIGSSLSFSDHVICADNEIGLLSNIIERGVQNAGDICSVNLHTRSMAGIKLTEVIDTFYPNNHSYGYINKMSEDGAKTFFWFDRRIHVDAGSRISENKIVALGRGRDNSIWGPYIELSAGIYYVDVVFVIYPACNNLLVRVCSMEPEEYYSEAFLANPKEGDLKISIPFCIDKDVDKLELLFSASEGSVFSLVKYIIKKNDDYVKPSNEQDMLSSVPTRKVYSLYGAETSYLTEVGRNDRYGNLISIKKRGTLSFGQNITLKAGRYTLKIYAVVEYLTGDEFISVTSERGSVKIIEHAPIKSNGGECCEIMEFVLTSKHEDVQVCVYVDNSTNITISRVAICEY